MNDKKEFFILICKVYEDLYKQVSMNEDFTLHLKSNDEVMLNNFIKYLDVKINSLNYKFICDYMEFQFSFWHNKKTKFGKGNVMLSWVFGKKAIERWENSTSFQKDKLRRFQLKTNVNNVSTYTRLIRKDNIIPLFLNPRPLEEEEKMRFFNTEEGLIHCTMNTTMYNHKSKNCTLCKFAKQCKQNLFINYKNIALLRGYKNEK